MKPEEYHQASASLKRLLDSDEPEIEDEETSQSGSDQRLVVRCWFCDAAPAHRRRMANGQHYKEPACDGCAEGMLSHGYPIDPSDIKTHNL